MQDDFSILKKGDTDPYLGKKIKEVVMSSNNFIVYIDEDNVIQWALGNGLQYDEANFGKVQNQVSYWESITKKLCCKEDRYEIAALLAEAYARMLDSNDYASAQTVIDVTVERIKKQGKEICRESYITSSLMTFLVILVILASLFVFRFDIKFLLGPEAYQILVYSLIGSIGSFISILVNSKKYNPEIIVGKNMHQLDGFLRIMLGCIAAFIVVVGIKANIIFGFANDNEHKFYVQLFLCVVAGYSESLIPNIIKNVENNSIK